MHPVDEGPGDPVTAGKRGENMRRLRVLVIVENYTRECLALHASSKIFGIDVVTTLERITQTHGFPKRIKVDNGPEFISQDLDRWAYWNKVELDFSRPGKPADNALVEALNSRLRQECLNQQESPKPDNFGPFLVDATGFEPVTSAL